MKKVVGLCGALLLIPAFMLMVWDVLTEDLISARMMKKNPQQSHTAEVVRNTRRNIWYRVKLDGKYLHTTARFQRRLIDFQEQILWSKDGKRFQFLVAGKPIYGYDANEERVLTHEEMLNWPDTPFSELGFQGILPETEADSQTPIAAPQIINPPWLKRPVDDAGASPDPPPIQGSNSVPDDSRQPAANSLD